MSLAEHIHVSALHHAYLIEGERALVLPELSLLLADLGIARAGNPDFHVREHDAFLLEHAHELRRMQSMHAAGEYKIFIVAFNTILSEAQNALLKTLEEPTRGTHFFFITRTGEVLLPTVRSRMQIIKDKRQITANKQKSKGEEFLNASLSERLKMIERYTKAKKDDKSEAKEEARDFLESLEHTLYRNIHEEKFASALASVLTAKRYLADRAPSVKILLEHIALTTPVVQI